MVRRDLVCGTEICSEGFDLILLNDWTMPSGQANGSIRFKIDGRPVKSVNKRTRVSNRKILISAPSDFVVYGLTLFDLPLLI